MIHVTFISIESTNTANVSRSKQKGVLTIRGNCSYGVPRTGVDIGRGGEQK